MNHQIKHRYTGAVLFECDVPEQKSGMVMRYTLEKAVQVGANLEGANLEGAYLARANLVGAKFSGDKLLIGKRPFFTIGPIGSRCALVSLWLTDKSPMVKAGCFTGTLEEFTAAVEKTHGETDHGKEYATAILMMESHATLWGGQHD